MGPLRTALQAERHRRAREALKLAGERLNLLEGGCGGSPEFGVFDVCGHYTGVDISPRGLELSRGQLSQIGIPFELREADLCRLPFADASFDAAYSARAI
jgi:ubiquinone/menaquinone biosynthesis C-methylase UbiE